jgi:hypothetical protein
MPSTLYAAKAQGATTSDLYTVDPTTAVMTSVGPIGYAVTGLAVDPTSGILYGVTSGNSAASPRSIITVDKLTGAGTLVGALGLAAGHGSADICFDAAGQMFGFDTHGAITSADSKLLLIDKTTGAASEPFASVGFGTNGDAMDFDLGGVLWLFPEGAGAAFLTTYYTVNPATGAATDQFPPNHLGFGPVDGNLNAGSCDAVGVFYAVLSGGAGTHLVTIDTATGTISDKGTLQSNTDALGWDNGLAVTLTAGFTATPLSGDAPLPVAFTDTSTGSPSTWAWDFGDGGTDTVQNPTHIYVTDGAFDVTLTVT